VDEWKRLIRWQAGFFSFDSDTRHYCLIIVPAPWRDTPGPTWHLVAAMLRKAPRVDELMAHFSAGRRCRMRRSLRIVRACEFACPAPRRRAQVSVGVHSGSYQAELAVTIKSLTAAAYELSSVTRAGQMVKYGQIGPLSGPPRALGSPEGAILVPFVAGRPAHALRSFPRLKALLALCPAGPAFLEQ
jgi:hypothetical protein